MHTAELPLIENRLTDQLALRVGWLIFPIHPLPLIKTLAGAVRTQLVLAQGHH